MIAKFDCFDNLSKASYIVKIMVIDGILYLWFACAFASVIYVLWDQFTNTPSLRIMTLAWVLMILYTGPIGLFLYFLSCRQPMPNTHDAFINIHWKQAVGSLIHCVAGDATAIIAMAAFLHYFEIPSGIEMILEYSAAYLFGLFIFQALFMRPMYTSYGAAIKKTIFAETVSMNMVMAGMLPTIAYIKYHYPEASDPFGIYFWGMMSLATIIGSIFAYPINSWMVKKDIKHGMMSQKMPMHHKEKKKKAPTLTKGQKWGWILGTLLFFFVIIAIVSFFAPIEFS